MADNKRPSRQRRDGPDLCDSFSYRLRMQLALTIDATR
jgi:hypothetical protein